MGNAICKSNSKPRKDRQSKYTNQDPDPVLIKSLDKESAEDMLMKSELRRR